MQSHAKAHSKDIRVMTYAEALKELRSKGSSRKPAIIRRLLDLCQNYDMAKKAYLTTAEYCPAPSDELLELMLSLANLPESRDIIRILKKRGEEDGYLDDARNLYNGYCFRVFYPRSFSAYGEYVPGYGIKKLSSIYWMSPDKSPERKEALDLLVKATEQALKHDWPKLAWLRGILEIPIHEADRSDPQIDFLFKAQEKARDLIAIGWPFEWRKKQRK